MPMISLFVLALYVFLQSIPAFGWFVVDPKLTAFVGLAFVILVIVEGLLYVRNGRFLFRRHDV